MSPMFDWQTLTQSLAAALDGQRVTHALFTTYCFEPEFFETSVVPALLPEVPALSAHSGLRRLQLERYLHRHPLPIDVYFDAEVALPGVPWLPYRALPVAIDGAFHGKIVLLRSESPNRARRIRWILGAGSANLTRAGWWENIEVFHFVPEFDPNAPPAAVLPGLRSLLDFLRQTRRGAPPLNSATAFLAAELAAASPRRADMGEARFEVLLPGRERQSFTASLTEALRRRGSAADRVEVISPYFPTDAPESLVNELLTAAQVKRLHLWLPQDSWNRRGTAVRMAEAEYRALSGVKASHWCQFADGELRNQATPEDPPATAVRRFLHAKVIRIPGRVAFIGSVNFSRAAFDRNFEAGFWFDDKDQQSWLEALQGGVKPNIFAPEPEASLLNEGDAAHPSLLASYDWTQRKIKVELLKPFGQLARPSEITLILADGDPVRLTLDLRMRLTHATAARIEAGLKTQPWLRVRWSEDAPPLSVWVDQAGLEYRPPPAELSLDLWRILDLWRGLDPADQGSDPDQTPAIEIALSRNGVVQGEDPLPPAGPPDDFFEQMSSVHAGLHLLRTRLLAAKEAKDSKTLSYYLLHQRPDTLPTLLDRLEGDAPESDPKRPDLVEIWTILYWVKQIAEDHSGQLTLGLKARVEDGLTRLAQEPAMAALTEARPGWLEWLAKMFLCPLGQERQRSQVRRRPATPHD